jgi:integrase/recombinase XerD
MQANAYLSTNEKIKLTPHMLRHSFLKRITDKYGLHVTQDLSGNVSIKEILRHTKQDNNQNTIWFRICFNSFDLYNLNRGSYH